MNQEKSLVNILNEVKSVLSGGITISGTPLTSIVTNTGNSATSLASINGQTANMDTNIFTISECVASQKLNVAQYINGFPMDAAAGGTDLGTPRFCIANDDVLLSSINTNINSINTNLSNINTNIVPAYDPGNGRIQVDQQTLNGFAIDAGAGNLSAGTQRICIASDDNLTGTIAIQTGRVAGCVDLGNNLLNVDNSMVSGTAISVNSGNKDAGCQRVVVATDDINLAHINAILTDVWDSTNHYLKVHVIP